MRTEKITILLAVIVGAGMLLTGSAAAAPENIYLEIQANGKGFEADTDSAPAAGLVYDESKHTLDTIRLYAWCDRAHGVMILAFYIASIDDWSTTAAAIIETEKNLLMKVPGMVVIYVDSDGMPVYSSGTMSVQFKVQNGTVKSAKMKSLAMSYWQPIDKNPANGETQIFGALKMKGKKIDAQDLPPKVQPLFGIAP